MAVKEYRLILACYLSGQMSEKQWQEHLQDKDFVEWLEINANTPTV